VSHWESVRVTSVRIALDAFGFGDQFAIARSPLHQSHRRWAGVLEETEESPKAGYPRGTVNDEGVKKLQQALPKYANQR